MKSFSETVLTARQRGISMVEIMVSLVAGLVLLAGMVQVYSGSKQTYRLQEAQGRMQENARFAFELLTRTIRGAGYRGCATGGTLTNTLTGPATHLYNFAFGLQGSEWTSTGTFSAADMAWTSTIAAYWTPSLDSSVAAVRPYNDVVTVRGALGGNIRLASAMASASGDVTVAAGNGLAQCDIVMVSNCNSASVMQITNATPSTSGTLSHATTGCTTPGNLAAALGVAYGTDAEVTPYGTTSYFIATGSNGEPSLFRRVGLATAEEMIEGVERMQIRYGEDTEALPTPPAQPDFTPNRYVTANNVTAWNRIISVRISLVLRSSEDNLTSETLPYQLEGSSVTPNPADRRLRHVFTTTIGLRNSLLN